MVAHLLFQLKRSNELITSQCFVYYFHGNDLSQAFVVYFLLLKKFWLKSLSLFPFGKMKTKNKY